MDEQEKKSKDQIKARQRKTNIIVITIVGVIILFYLIGVAGEKSEPASSGAASGTETQQEEVLSTNTNTEKNTPMVVGIGDTITSEAAEITLKHVELSYDVLPEQKKSFYVHYAADSGQVYIDISVNVKNTQKQLLPCTDIMKVTANYNDGYTYTAFPVIEDSDTGFTYANITSIDPLETKGMRFLIDCPQEIEETDNSLYLEFQVGKEKYTYTIR